ncbi:hypothetical protein DOY81_008088, partial [Sarcophaga bullata]
MSVKEPNTRKVSSKATATEIGFLFLKSTCKAYKARRHQEVDNVMASVLGLAVKNLKATRLQQNARKMLSIYGIGASVSLNGIVYSPQPFVLLIELLIITVN